MEVIQHGKVLNGTLILTNPVPLPEGTEVLVRIEPVAAALPAAPESETDFLSLPFFGMWADREDMKDAQAWVRQEREKWHQRAKRQD